MINWKKLLYTTLMFNALFLTGCANAGKDQKVEADESVTLDGSKSKADLFGDVTKYRWKQVKLKGKSELKVELAGKNTATPSFTAPSVDKKTSLYFRLVATETGGVISPFTTKDTVSVEVSPTTTTNKAPKAKATANPKKVLEGEVVLFDGSASSDDDGTIVSYAWSDEEANVLSTEQSFSHSFSVKGKHTITLKVTDDEGASNSTTVRVKVKEAPKPKVSILVDQVQTTEKTVVQGTTLAFTAVLLEDDEHKDKKHHKKEHDKKEHKKHKKHHDDDTPVYTWKDAQGNILSHEMSFSQMFTTVGSHVITLEVTEGDDDDDRHIANVTIIVIDVTPPVLTLNGEANITLVQDAVYTELGATALDAVDGNILVNINGTVNTAVVGTYTLTYTSQDKAGNEANTTRTIRVIDVTPPVITLNGEATITLEQNIAYTELGATALDAVDGNVSVNISGTVDTGMIGNYTIVYTAQDNSGNESNATRTITIIDVTPPVITLNGEANITLVQDAVYTELGATAQDAVDGNVSVNISGTVNTAEVGTYTLTYTAQDKAGNEANITRSITIIDVTPPVITLNGEANITLEQHAVYTELGATALDAVDGNVSVNISGTVDTATVGNYVVTYSAQDISGNEANITRVVTVIDVTPPVLTLNGQATITLVQNAVYTELGATALDAVDGNVSVNISGTVNTAVVGTYTLTYTAQDKAGNEANITRSITIIDVTPPVITLNGEVNMTLEQDAVYTELGATALDAVNGNVSVTVSGMIDTATVGNYTVTYTAQDSAGNEANITRSITIIDVTPPVITLNGEVNMTLEQDAVYTELGATALDAVDGNVSVSINGTVDTTTIGEYILTYTATDSSGNSASVSRTVQVEQRFLPPSISILEELESTLAQSVVPYNRITLELNTTSTVKLTALNQTLEDEQNRSIQIKGVDNNGTFYLYNVPLVKGINIIRLQATNGADEVVEQNITVNAEVNQTVPIGMRATEYEGVQSLDTTVEVGTLDLNVTEYLFDVEADGKIDTIQTDANFTLHLTQEGRYRPRVTVRTSKGLLFSSDDYALSLDVKATADQKDPAGAEPIDIAKAFVQALLEDDREKVERFFLYSGSRWIRMLYEDDARRASMREHLRNINELDWKQEYQPSGAATVTTTVHDSNMNKDIPIGFELTPAKFDGMPRGRMWFVRAFY